MRRKETAAGEEILVLHERWVRAVQKHLREIVTAIVAIVLVLSLLTGYRTYHERKEAKAALLYAQAISLKDMEAARKKLEEVVQKYSGTVAAREALLNLWELSLAKRSPDLQTRLKALKRKAPGELKFSFSLAEGYLLEEKGKYKEAEQKYQKVLKKAPFSGIVVYADLARVYEALRDWPKALEAYRKYLELKPPLGGLHFVEYKLAKIEQVLSKTK